MATYQVTDKDGTTYKVKGPAGATEKQLIAAVIAQKGRDRIAGLRSELEELRANRFIPEPEEEDTTLVGNVLRGVPAGFVQGLETAALGAITPLEEEKEVAARDVIRSIADAVKPELANPEELSAKLAQGVGSFLSLLPAAFTGPLAPVLVPSMAASMGVGEASERARAGGATQEERNVAARWGIAPGLLDVIPLARISRRFAPALNDVVSKIGPQELKGWGSRIQRAAVTGGIEGAQETAQGLLQNAIEKGVYNPDRGIITGDALEEGGIGLGAGAIVQGLVDAFVGFGKRTGKGEAGGPEETPALPAPEETLALPAPDPDSPRTVIPSGPTLPVTQEGVPLTPEQVIERERIVGDRPDPSVVTQPETSEELRREAARLAEARAATEEREALQDALFDLERRGDPAALDRVGLTPTQQELPGLETTREARANRARATAAADRQAAVERETEALRELGQPERAIDDPTWTTEPGQDAVRTAIERGEAAERRLTAPLLPTPIEDEIASQQELEAQEAARAAETPRVIPDARRERIEARQERDLTRGEQTRGELPGLGRVRTRAETPAPASPITATTLEGIPKSTPTYKKLTRLGKEGKDTSDPEVRTILEAHEERINDRKPSKRNTEQLETIQGLLRGTPKGSVLPKRETTETEAAQPVLFPDPAPRTVGQPQSEMFPFREEGDRGRRGRPAPDQGEPFDARQQRRPEEAPPQDPFTTTPLGQSIVQPQPRAGRAGPRDTARQRAAAGDTAPADITPITPPAVGSPADRADRPDGRTRQRRAALDKEVVGRAAQKATKPAPKKAAPKKAAAEKTAPKKTTARKTTTKKTTTKKTTTKKAAPKKTTTKKKATSKQLTDLQAAREAALDEYEARGSEVRKDVKLFTDITAQDDVQVDLTDADAKVITSLLEMKLPNRLDAGRRVEFIKKKGITEEQLVRVIAARGYFLAHNDPRAALEVMVHDAMWGTTQYRGIRATDEEIKEYTEAEDAYFGQMFQRRLWSGSKRASEALEWVESKLSPELKKQIEILKTEAKRRSDYDAYLEEIATPNKGVSEKQALDRYEKETKTPELTRTEKVFKEATDKQRQEDVAAHEKEKQRIYKEFEGLKERGYVKEAPLTEELDVTPLEEAGIDYNVAAELELPANEVKGLDVPVHPVIRNLLKKGNLKRALYVLARTTPVGRISKIAAKLSDKLGDTKVEIVTNLKNEAGKRTAGLFDPKTNTIKLDSELGINTHTLLHETTHALTSAALAGKNSSYARQLKKLFNDVKDQLDSWYGAQSADEFVAEAFGNPEFQQTLARIVPKSTYIKNGRPVNALERFYNLVRNFVRRIVWGTPSKPVESALDQIDALIDGMLAPAPQFRNAGALYYDPNGAARRFAAGLGRIQNSFPSLDAAYRSDFGQRVRSFFGNTTDTTAKKGLLWLAPLQALGDVAQAYGFGRLGLDLHDAIQNMVGNQGKAETAADGTYTRLERWFKKATRAQKDAFNRVVFDSTREQVDPTKDRSVYENETDETVRADKLAAWDGMQKDWGIVKEAGGVATYTEMRDSYKHIFTKLNKILNETIDNLEGLTPDSKRELKDDIFKKVFEKAHIDPYFPLTRKGEFWLQFTGKDSRGRPEPVFMAFDNPSAREDFIQSDLVGNSEIALNAEGEQDIIRYENLDQAAQQAGANAPAGSFIRDTQKILSANRVGEDAQLEFMRLFIDVLPESSFAKSLSKRGNEGRGRAGFIQDSMEAYKLKAYHLAQQTERLRSRNEIQAIREKIRDEYNILKKKDAKSAKDAKLVSEALDHAAKFALNPPSDRPAATANRIAFMMTIGFNVSSAMVNMSQVPLFMFPMLGGKYGFRKSGAALGRAARLFAGSGTDRRVTTLKEDNTYEDIKGMPSIDNYFFEHIDRTTDAEGNEREVRSFKIKPEVLKNISKEKKAELEDLAILAKLAQDRAQLGRSLLYDTLGLQKGGRDKSTWDYTTAVSAWMFHQVERSNRQVAMVSTYQLELDRLRGKDPKKTTAKERGLSEAQMRDVAAEEAIFQAQQINGGAFLATAPRLAQEGLGRVAMMYKTFGVQMHYTMFKTAYTALRNAPPAERAAAMRQLVGVAGMSVLLAGVQGLPMFGAVMMVANMFLDDDEDDAETIVRKAIGEGWYKGPVTKYSGVDVANRIGLSNLFFRMNPYNQNMSPADYVGAVVGGPAWSISTQMLRGGQQVLDGDLYRGIETMVPAAVRNVMKVNRWQDEGEIRSRRHDIILDDVTTLDLASQLFGFAPVRYTLQQEKNLSTKRIDRATNTRRTGILRELYVTRRMGDSDGYREALKKLHKFNKDHRGWAIDFESFSKSMKQHIRTSGEMVSGITISPRMRRELLQHQRDYWGDE